MKKFFKDVLHEVDTLFNLKIKSGGVVQTSGDDSRFWKSLNAYLSSVDSMEVEDPYEKSVWVFASINAIAQNISRVPFHIYREIDKDVKTTVVEGELYDLITNPNPYMITSSLFFATVLFMELFGEAFWLIDRKNITEVPNEIWAIQPTRMKPIIENGVFKGSWEYKVGNVREVFAPHQVLHFKYFNPYDDIRGLSAMQASRAGVEQDYFANKYNKQFFKEGVALSGLIKVPDILPTDVFNRMINQFGERHSGYGKAHKIGIIEGGADFINTPTMSQKDMEFSILKTVIRGEILAAFKTNEVVLGKYENIQSYEGIRNAHEQFWRETLLPKLTYIEEFLWAKFFSKIKNGEFWGGFDLSSIEALRDDYNKKIEAAVKLVEIGFTANEVNKRLDLGFEEKPWRDAWWIKTGIIPAENAMDFLGTPVDDPVNEPSDDPKEPETEPIDEEDPKKDINLSIREDSLWANYLSRQNDLEILFKKKIKRFLYEQRKRVLEGVYKNSQIIFDEKKEETLFSESISGLYSLTIKESVDLLKAEYAFEVVDEVSKKEMAEKIKSRLVFSVKTVISSTKKKIDKILEDKDITSRAKKIREFYNKIDNLAIKIARTESSHMINGLRFILMRNIGIKYHKWVSRSEKGRHSKFDGKIVKIGDSFSKEFIIRYPLDDEAPVNEVIMCRCYCVPAIKAN